jgi:hypothetical protein
MDLANFLIYIMLLMLQRRMLHRNACRFFGDSKDEVQDHVEARRRTDEAGNVENRNGKRLAGEGSARLGATWVDDSGYLSPKSGELRNKGGAGLTYPCILFECLERPMVCVFCDFSGQVRKGIFCNEDEASGV